MQTGGVKQTRPHSSRSELRNNTLTERRPIQRPSSAKGAERPLMRNNLGAKYRSNSAREKPEEIKEPPEEVEESKYEHKQGCPWQKARSRSKFKCGGVIESSSGMMHPKPWGARNPTDIPCFCRAPRETPSLQPSQRPTKVTEIKSPGKSAKAKIIDIVDNFGVFLERRKIRITENELGFLMKKLEEKIQQKFVDKISKQKAESKPDKKQKSSPHPMAQQKSMSREHMLELQKAKMSNGPGSNILGKLEAKMANGPSTNILGKLETKKYFLELTAEDQVPPNFRNILGTMNPSMIHPTEKMLIAVDDKQPYLASLPEDYRHYSVKTLDMDSYAGVQLHHQAENTTLLLAANPTRKGMVSSQPIVGNKGHMSPLNYKTSRRT